MSLSTVDKSCMILCSQDSVGRTNACSANCLYPEFLSPQIHGDLADLEARYISAKENVQGVNNRLKPIQNGA